MVNKKGVTLVELMITVAIMGILYLGISQTLQQVFRFYKLNNALIELQREARITMEIMTKNIRQAQSNTIRIDYLSGQPYYSRINFTKIQGDNISYYQQGKTLILIDDGKTKTLSNNLMYLAFAFPRSDDMTIVSVTITLGKDIYELKQKTIRMASEKVRVMN